MQRVLIRSLLAAGVLFVAPNAFAMSSSDLGRSIKANHSTVLHQTAGKRHGMRGCRFSHGKLICGGHRNRGHNDRRGHGKKHGGGRH